MSGRLWRAGKRLEFRYASDDFGKDLRILPPWRAGGDQSPDSRFQTRRSDAQTLAAPWKSQNNNRKSSKTSLPMIEARKLSSSNNGWARIYETLIQYSTVSNRHWKPAPSFLDALTPGILTCCFVPALYHQLCTSLYLSHNINGSERDFSCSCVACSLCSVSRHTALFLPARTPPDSLVLH